MHMTTSAAGGIVPQWTMGDRLRKAREITGLDAKDFADEIGLSRNTVGNYESDKTKPRTMALRTWALRCGVSVKWLETGYAPGSPDGDVNSGWRTPGTLGAIVSPDCRGSRIAA